MPQSLVRTVQTVQKVGDSTAQFFEVLDSPSLCNDWLGMVQTVLFFDKVVDVPIVQVLGGAAAAVPAVLDVPVITQRRWVATVQVPQIQFIAGVSGHSCLLETGTGMAAMNGFFGFFQAIFCAPPDCLELSASFGVGEPSMMKSCSSSRARGWR